MGLFTKEIEKLDDLFVHQLQDIYYAENQITKALPTMIEKATSPKLKQGFQTHLTETQNQIKRLEQVFQMHGHDAARASNCPAIDGIIEEAEEVAGDVADKEVLDAALIASAQAVEHYEMTRYGTLIAWAKQLGRQDCASVLEQNLNEEKAADQKLTALAESLSTGRQRSPQAMRRRAGRRGMPTARLAARQRRGDDRFQILAGNDQRAWLRPRSAHRSSCGQVALSAAAPVLPAGPRTPCAPGRTRSGTPR